MCGITGIVGCRSQHTHNGSDVIRRMLAMIRHRGPDQVGVYTDAMAVLGSVRLSIIDIETGNQPISNEDGSLWIVYNGEVFNYLELRPDLESRGHRFTTNTDTEVVLHLYEEYGPACLERLNGEFAFAIWDNRRQTVFLARDRFGIRPLYYAVVDTVLMFASEIKALLAHPDIPLRLDVRSVDQVLTYWSPLPGHTPFRGIHQLPPAHSLTSQDGQLKLTRYWSLEFPTEAETSPRYAVERDYLEEFRHLLSDATRIRMRSDVPLGSYLSGGLDSSLITKLAATASATTLATFSVAFDDPEFDESPFQLRMSRLLGTRHEVMVATHADIAREFPAVIWHTETPITRTAPVPLFMLSKLVRDCGIKVVLTGEGADEMLGGYDLFKEAAIRRFWARNLRSQLRPALLRRLYPEIPGVQGMSTSCLAAFFRPNLNDIDTPFFSHLLRWRNNARIRRLYSADMSRELDSASKTIVPNIDLPSGFESWGALQRSQYLEIILFMSEYLLSSQGDRVAMAHSVESRLPFLDYRVAEFCNRLPSNQKLRGLRDKYLLRRFGRELLPIDVWGRRKRPYRAPIHKSLLCKDAPEYVMELLSDTHIRDVGLFRPDSVRQLINKVRTREAGSESDDMALAGILSTQLLHHMFCDKVVTKPPIDEADVSVNIVASPRAAVS